MRSIFYIYTFLKTCRQPPFIKSFVNQAQGTISQFFSTSRAQINVQSGPFQPYAYVVSLHQSDIKIRSIAEPTQFDFYSKNRPVAESLCLQLHLGLLQLFALLFVLPQKGCQLAALVVVAPLQRRHLLLEPADLLLLRLQLCLSVQGLWSHVEKKYVFCQCDNILQIN